LGYAAPDLTQALEDDPMVITIGWAELPGSTKGNTPETWVDYGNGKPVVNSISINIDISLRVNTEDTIKNLGHEGFHALCDLNGFMNNSRLEEAYAYNYGRAIDSKLNRGWWYDTMVASSNPYDDVRYPGNLDTIMDGYLNNNVWNPPWWRFWDLGNTAYRALDIYPSRKGDMHNLYLQYYPGN
jgi:hypothetical protein